MKLPNPQFGFRTLLVVMTILGLLSYAFADSLLVRLQQWTGPGVGVIDFRTRSEEKDAFAWRSFEEMHAHFVQEFVESEGFGASRIVPVNQGWVKQLIVNSQSFRLQRMELIAWMRTGEPVAYQSRGENPLRVTIHEHPTRPLDALETKVVPYLRGGGKPVLHQDQRGATILAPLTARQACLACHEDAREGEVLGVFSYRMEPVFAVFDRTREMLQRGDGGAAPGEAAP